MFITFFFIPEHHMHFINQWHLQFTQMLYGYNPISSVIELFPLNDFFFIPEKMLHDMSHLMAGRLLEGPIIMMTSSNGNSFRVAGPLCGEFPLQRPVTRSFDVSLICAWINGWVNNRRAGDLRRYRAHYDVTVMIEWQLIPTKHHHEFFVTN